MSNWLLSATKRLQDAGIATARLDCLVLLEDATGKERSWLLAHPEHPLDNTRLERLGRQLERRANHTPLSFIRGKTEFYGREFIITEDVLEPRPESETMIDMLKGLKPSGKIVDVGTGSGALGITAALELPDCQVELLDIDRKALAVARKNAATFDLKLAAYHSDLLEKAPQADVLLANLPYVPDDYALNDAAMNEPRVAIFGGPDGLRLYANLFEQLKNRPVRYVFTESLPFQHQELSKIAAAAGYEQTEEEDFIQLFSTE